MCNQSDKDCPFGEADLVFQRILVTKCDGSVTSHCDAVGSGLVGKFAFSRTKSEFLVLSMLFDFFHVFRSMVSF